MIEKTSKQKLLESGILKKENDFDIWIQVGHTLYGPGLNQITHVSPGPGSLTYTGIDAQRKLYLQNPNGLVFPTNNFDLMIEYYSLAFEEFFKTYAGNKVEGSSMDKWQAETVFLKRQIDFIKKNIEGVEKNPAKFRRVSFREQETFSLIELGRYLKWLEGKSIEAGAQIGSNKYTSTTNNKKSVITTGNDYPGVIKEFVTLIEDVLEHHISNVIGFLEYKYGLVPTNHGAKNYWLLELHKHLFWAEQVEQSLETLDKLKWAHKWQEKIQRQSIIDFNNSVNGLSTTPKNEEQKNQYPLIFKNGPAYKMFSELQQLTVKQRTRVADYSFIFHKMKDRNFYAINKAVTEPAFIEFLNANYNTDIAVDKLPFKNPDSKQQIYATILAKYKNDLLK